MDTIQAINERRAVKHFDPSFKIPDEEIGQLFDLCLQSPTAFNIQHWRIVNVTDAGLRKEIQAVAWDQAQVTEASHLLDLPPIKWTVS